MNWSNLKKNKCPKCNKDFMQGLMTHPMAGGQLLSHPCGFSIGERRYSQIVSNQVSREVQDELENESMVE